MSEIISDGVRSITSEYGYNGYNHDRSNFLDAFLNTQNSWREDSHGAERTATVINEVKEAELATEKVGAAAQLATEKTSAAIQLAQSLSFSNLQNMLVGGFKDVRFDAATNTANLQHELAECCCEIKERIREDGDVTRALINDIDRTNKAVELVDVKNQLAAALAGRE